MPKRFSGNEELSINDLVLSEATVLDFWRWAFSDLKANNIRGIFAEWLVAKLLDIDAPIRDSWAECDLCTHEGIKIEVKASAYLQSWKQKRLSTITFNGLCGQTLNPDNSYSGIRTYNADLYVFCIQTEKESEKWDALDLDQWRFYILTKQNIEQTGCKSLGLSTVKKMTNELNAEEFCYHAQQMIKACCVQSPTNKTPQSH